jgi:hypothetical protein
MSDVLNFNDFVFAKTAGKITSGGFGINSILMNSNKSPMTTMNSNITGGSNFSDIFNNLAIPVGLTSFKNGGADFSFNESKETTHVDESDNVPKNEPKNESKKQKKTKNNKKISKQTKRLKFAPSVAIKR